MCRTTQLGSFSRRQDDPTPARCWRCYIGCPFSRESSTNLLTFKVRNTSTPACLCRLIQDRQLSHNLRRRCVNRLRRRHLQSSSSDAQLGLSGTCYLKLFSIASVDVVFLDLAKAFDKVPHKRLLEKLRKHGIGGKLLNVIDNWLSNRKQRVCIKSRWSSWMSV